MFCLLMFVSCANVLCLCTGKISFACYFLKLIDLEEQHYVIFKISFGLAISKCWAELQTKIKVDDFYAVYIGAPQS